MMPLKITRVRKENKEQESRSAVCRQLEYFESGQAGTLPGLLLSGVTQNLLAGHLTDVLHAVLHHQTRRPSPVGALRKTGTSYGLKLSFIPKKQKQQQKLNITKYTSTTEFL